MRAGEPVVRKVLPRYQVDVVELLRLKYVNKPDIVKNNVKNMLNKQAC